MKYCIKCKEKKFVSEFHNSISDKSGKSKYCKKCQIESQKKSNTKHSDRVRWQDRKRKAKKRKIEFELTRQEINILYDATECFYCGESIEFINKILEKIRQEKQFKSISWGKQPPITLDRYDNQIGYTIGNTVPACWVCNKIKGEFIHGDEMKLIANMVMNRIKNILNV